MTQETITTYTPEGYLQEPPELQSGEPDPLDNEAPGLSIEKVESVVLQFSPRTEVDPNNDTIHTIYEHGDATFSFVGRDETPDFPTLESSRPSYLGRESVSQALYKQVIVGNNPRDWENRDYNQVYVDYRDTLRERREQNKGKPEHLLAEQSPYGVYALLERIQPDEPHWSQQREAIANNDYNEESLYLIDAILSIDREVASSLENDRKNFSSAAIEEHPPLGEAVMVAAALGDSEAQQLADEAVARLRAEQESNRKQREQEIKQLVRSNEERLSQVEAYRPEELLAVHATEYEPNVTQDGYEIYTTHDTVGYPRSTLHTSINHKVEDHFRGNWGYRGYVLIAPFDKMMDANGPPANLYGVDTWWTRNPGEALQLPEATLVAPSADEDAPPVSRENGRIEYKTTGYGQDDIEQLKKELVHWIDPGEQSYDTGEEQADLQDRANKLVERRVLAEARSSDGEEIEFENTEVQHGIAARLRDLLVELEITNVRGKELLRPKNEHGMHSNDQLRLDKLGLELGSGTEEHTGSGANLLEKGVADGKRSIMDPVYDLKPLRVALASGTMNSRGTAKKRHEQSKQLLW